MEISRSIVHICREMFIIKKLEDNFCDLNTQRIKKDRKKNNTIPLMPIANVFLISAPCIASTSITRRNLITKSIGLFGDSRFTLIYFVSFPTHSANAIVDISSQRSIELI